MEMFILNLFVLMTLLQLVASIQFLLPGPKNSDTYGPYFLGFKYFGSCPHSENNLANLSISVECEKSLYKGCINVTIGAPVRIVEMKVVIYSIKNNRKNPLWDYTIEKPCQNRLFSGQIKPHADIRTCVLKKGTHSIAINFSESAYLFFGSSFFYGEYISKFTVISAKKQNILCVIDDLIVQKSLDTCHVPRTDLQNVT